MKSPTIVGQCWIMLNVGELVDHEVTYHYWSALDNVKRGKLMDHEDTYHC